MALQGEGYNALRNTFYQTGTDRSKQKQGKNFAEAEGPRTEVHRCEGLPMRTPTLYCPQRLPCPTRPAPLTTRAS